MRADRFRRGSTPRGALAALLILGVVLAPSTAMPVRADDTALRTRITELREAAEAAGATDLLEHAERALIEADRQRVLGTTAAVERATAIAEAALRAADRRVAAHRARGDRDAARARLSELEARARQARRALEAARAERARLERSAATAPASVEAPAVQEGE